MAPLIETRPFRAAGLGKLSFPGGNDDRVYPTKSALNQAEDTGYTANDGAQTWAAIVDFRDKRTAARFQELATAAAVAASERVRGAA
jgi:hypothetical protein